MNHTNSVIFNFIIPRQSLNHHYFTFRQCNIIAFESTGAAVGLHHGQATESNEREIPSKQNQFSNEFVNKQKLKWLLK